MSDTSAHRLPDDDATRSLIVTSIEDPALPHLGVAGGTYTIVIDGDQTEGAYTLIDMLVPPDAGPGPHRHDFEELFLVFAGDVEFTFRGETTLVGAGAVVGVPANAPHRFRNAGDDVAHLLCLCTPAAQDGFFREVGEPLPSRAAHPTPLEGDALRSWIAAAAAAAPRYRTELL